MRKASLLVAATFLFTVLFWSTVPVGCATIVPPEGGPKDTLPPVLLRAEPGDSTVNFRGKFITLTFNENIDLKDLGNNRSFTPEFSRVPELRVDRQELRIHFKYDTLRPNTTYVLNFGNALVDLNEGNPLRDFTYAFSTGPYLDSLELSGRVVLAESGGVDSNLVVLLHRNLADSAVLSQSPQYVARLNAQGYFRFRYLPSDTFAIYALGGTGRQYRDTTSLFAFADRPVIAGRTDSIVLYAFRGGGQAGTRAPAPAGVRVPINDRRLRFTTPPEGQPQDLLEDYVLNFPVPLRRFDSTRIRLTADSVFRPVAYTARLDSTRRELRIRSEWQENTRYNLELEQAFAADTANRQLLKGDTLFFTTRRASEYAGITLRLRNLDLSRRPLLQFLLNGSVVQTIPVATSVYSSPRMLPGEYELRIVYDVNGNGRWDPGSFRLRRQPEPVRPVEGRITVKAASDNEFERIVQ